MGRKPKFQVGDRVTWEMFGTHKLHPFSAEVVKVKRKFTSSGKTWYYWLRYLDPQTKEQRWHNAIHEKWLFPAQVEMSNVLSKRDLYEIDDPSIGYLGPNTYFTAGEEDETEQKTKKKPVR